MATHDFRDLCSPPFVYTIVVYNGATGEAEPPKTVVLDLDAIGVALSLSIPTAFQPTGETRVDPETGEQRPVMGLHKIRECIRDNTPIPENLPRFEEVDIAIRKALRVPAGIVGPKVVAAIFAAYMAEYARRAEVKKDTPSSPDSPAPTQAQSGLVI